jgi:hypothetical protein
MGGESYSTIIDEMCKLINANSGAMHIEALVATLQDRFGASENSVRTYASSWRFSRDRTGLVRVRDEPVADASSHSRDIEVTRRCYRAVDGWALRIDVNPEILRGSGFPAPAPLARYLDVAPGQTRTFHSPTGDFRLYWSSPQPQCSSVRPRAEYWGPRSGIFYLRSSWRQMRCDTSW